jgi:two-component system chemotaxis response regulator CheB
VVIVSSLGSQGEAAMRTLELGAVEFIHKPSQFDPTVLRQLGEMLVEKVKAAAVSDVSSPQARASRPKPAPSSAKITGGSLRPQAELKAIAVGGNAGSPNSLTSILQSLPADTPPVLVANGTIVSFLESYIAQLKKRVKVSLCVAKQGDTLKMGHVYFAPQEMQMRVAGGSPLTVDLRKEGPVCGQLPSSNVLFESAAKTIGAGMGAILLGGFGSDGVDGLEKVRGQGGFTIAENPADAAFPYAPQKAVEIGVVDKILSASEISEALTELRNKRVAA